MRPAASSLQCFVMSSSRPSPRGRNPWRRGFCDRPPPEGCGNGVFVSGDSHLQTVRGANYGWRQGPTRAEVLAPRPQFRPWRPPHFRQPPLDFHSPPPHFSQPPQQFRQPPPKPADFRKWNYALSHPPPQCERFTVLSYNILADYLAREHRSKLYFHIPHHILDWEWRKRRLLIEFGLWAPDVMCIQEVDRFADLEAELAVRGYSGIWKMRTGNAVDGCAIFWRTNKFQLRHEEHIEFSKLGLRDNVAQICVLESRIQRPVENVSASLPTSSSSRRDNNVIICNVHVLYNPKRGEIKLGQVRVLLDRAYTISRIWDDAPVIVCGDFNCTPKSPLYNFISEQKINLSGLARDQVSGQSSASVYRPRAFVGSGLYRVQPHAGDDSKGKINAEQSSNCSEMHKHSDPENDMESMPETKKHQPRIKIGMPDISGKPSADSIHENNAVSDILKEGIGEADLLDNPCVGSSSTHCGLAYPKETSETCDKLSRNPTGLGCDGEKELAATVSHYNDSSSNVLQQVHGDNDSINEISHSIRSLLRKDGSPSICRSSNEIIDAIDLDSCSKNENYELSQGFVDSSTHFASNVGLNVSSMSTRNQVLTGYELQEEELNVSQLSSSKVSDCIESSQSAMASMKAVNAEAVLDSKLPDDVAIGISSFKSTSETFAANIGSSLDKLKNPSDFLTAEQEKAGPVTLAENTSERNLSDLSTNCESSLGLKLGSVSHKRMECIAIKDASYGGDDRIISSSDNIIYYHKSTQLETEEASQGSRKSSSRGVILREELENQTGASQVDILTADICSSEESSDPNFFKELLGTGDECEFGEDTICVTSSGQTQPCVEAQEDSPVPLAQPATDQEKHIYNPFLWTPMEVEVASGNAECTYVEHHLKLRSAYADVEDYAGTKDLNREPQVTSYNRQFMGTVDYIWYSKGLQTVKVLDTIPKHVLQRTSGFPTQKWGSDHLALACEFAFTKDLQTK